MSKKLIYLTSFVLVLSMAGNTSADLVGHWGFDEGSGSVAHDTSGNGHDGTFEGNPQWVAGRFGTALEFDGDDYVDIPSGVAELGAADFTIAAWIKTTEIGMAILSKSNGDDGWASMEKQIYIADSATSEGDNDGTVEYVGWGCEWIRGSIRVDDGQWHHVALTWDMGAGAGHVYIDGVEGTYEVNFNGGADNAGDTIRIGFSPGEHSAHFIGLIDDVRIYNDILSEAEILAAMEGGEGYPYALGPEPADGALLTNRWVTLGWSQGQFAVSHDVYLSDNFDDVNDGTPDTFRGNQPLAQTTFFVGFIGYPYPDGLVPGTTYYWRIDEVNDTDPNSPWKGPVWSFWIQPRIAYGPTPAEGAKFVDPNADLNWTAGLGAGLHYVYFGDNFDDVNDAVGGPMQTATTYTPGTLEFDKTYYWRVDESDDAVTMLKGDVWSFKTLPEIPITDPNLVGWWKLDEGTGTTVVDWSGHGNHGTLYGNPQWVSGYDGDALDFDGSGDYVGTGKSLLNNISQFTLAGWVSAGNPEAGRIGLFGQNDVVEFGFQGGDIHIYTSGGGEARTAWTLPNLTWHHITVVGDGTSLTVYVDGEVVVTGGSATASYGTAGFTFNIGGGGVWDASGNWFSGQIDDVRVYNKALTLDEIQQAMRGDPLLAGNPNPTNGSTPYIREATPLSWLPGDNASQHDVYFGTDRGTVADANASDTTGVYRGWQFGTSYTPLEGVEWGGGPYYWRVDENNTDATISTGRIWSFTVADFIGIEDFEDYNDYEPDTIFDAWLDGWGVDTNGSEVGYAEPDFPGGEHFVETNIVHGGSQSMPYFYDTNFKYSEATYSPTQRDWTEEGVEILSLWFYGDEANAAARMYVALNGGTAVYHDNANAVQIEEWTEWTIELQEFTGVNLTNVNTLAIGFGDKNNLQAGGTGFVLFDDIRLYRPAPEPQP